MLRVHRPTFVHVGGERVLGENNPDTLFYNYARC